MIEQPCLLSSLKNISSFLNSSKARISNAPNAIQIQTKQKIKIAHKGEIVDDKDLTEFVVFVRRESRSPKLRQHLSGVLEDFSEIVGVLNQNREN